MFVIVDRKSSIGWNASLLFREPVQSAAFERSQSDKLVARVTTMNMVKKNEGKPTREVRIYVCTILPPLDVTRALSPTPYRNQAVHKLFDGRLSRSMANFPPESRINSNMCTSVCVVRMSLVYLCKYTHTH